MISEAEYYGEEYIGRLCLDILKESAELSSSVSHLLEGIGDVAAIIEEVGDIQLVCTKLLEAYDAVPDMKKKEIQRKSLLMEKMLRGGLCN